MYLLWNDLGDDQHNHFFIFQLPGIVFDYRLYDQVSSSVANLLARFSALFRRKDEKYTKIRLLKMGARFETRELNNDSGPK